MNRIKLIGFISLLGSAAVVCAAPCSGFELKIKNNLADVLVVTEMKLNGAEIQPQGIQKLNAHSEQVFTITNSENAVPMTGEFLFHSLTLPSKEVRIQYMLLNNGIMCEHEDLSAATDYAVEKSRLPGQVKYTINDSAESFTK